IPGVISLAFYPRQKRPLAHVGAPDVCAYDVFKRSSYFLFCVNFFITNARHNAVLRRSPDVYAAPGETKTTHNLGQIDD
ncbi:hypothetical protein, partial [Salmonella enterica]|uniref:hypothetical protein n=1 Tax=Salmonella enterica TaxID=28901 RepID=UPI0021D4C4AB